MTVTINAENMSLKECNARIREAIMQGEEVRVSHTSAVNGLAAGFKDGRLVFEGNVGDYCGILNDGANIEVEGSSGRFLGDGMTDGRIAVHGDAKDGVGLYCSGGTIYIEGSAEDFLATMNKGGTVIVKGDVGTDAGTYMLAGTIIILGDAGRSLGHYLIGGTIFLLGDYESLGNNAVIEKLMSRDIDHLSSVVERMDMGVSPRSFRKIGPRSSKPFYQEPSSPRGVD